MLAPDVACNYNQSFFYHTSYTDASCFLVVEIAATVISAVDMTLATSKRRGTCMSLGWSIIPMCSSDAASTGMITLQLYPGSPRVLFMTDEPIVTFCANSLKLLPHTRIAISHTLVTQDDAVLRWIPENTLIGMNDEVPGVLASADDYTLFMNTVQLLPTFEIFIDKISIHAAMRLDEFEEHLKVCNLTILMFWD
jgi:hypothetical protein